MGRVLLSLLEARPSPTPEAVRLCSTLPAADKAVVGKVQDAGKGQTVDQSRPEMWLCFWWWMLNLSINSLIPQMNQIGHLESLSLRYINSFIWTQTPSYMKKAITPN